jgi:hypothetical protein
VARILPGAGKKAPKPKPSSQKRAREEIDEEYEEEEAYAEKEEAEEILEPRGIILHRLLAGRNDYILIFNNFTGLTITCEFDYQSIKVNYRIKAPDPVGCGCRTQYDFFGKTHPDGYEACN